MRPNLPSQFVAYQIIYLLIDATGATPNSHHLVAVLVLMSSVCFLFAYLVAQVRLQFDTFVSIFVAISYTFAVTTNSIMNNSVSSGILPFYFVSTVFPVILYVSMAPLGNIKIRQSLLATIPFYVVYTSGYVPLAIHATAVALMCGALMIYLRDDLPKSAGETMKSCLQFILPAAIPGAVLLPYFLAIMNYHELVTGLPKYPWFATSDLKYGPNHLLAIISWSIVPQPIRPEIPHITIGIITAFLAVIGLIFHKRLEVTDHNKRFLSLCLMLFFFHIFLATGDASGIGGLFHYLIPALGDMHHYGRFLSHSSFLLFIFCGAALQTLLRKNLGGSGILLGSIVVLLSWLLFNFSDSDKLNFSSGLTEIALAACSLALILRFRSTTSTLILSFCLYSTFFGSAAYNYLQYRPGNMPWSYQALNRDVAGFTELAEIMHQNTNKGLVKYVDLTGTISKRYGPQLNYPWLLGRDKPTANYMGYELHLSMESTYLNSGFRWFDVSNKQWIENTGADFAIYNEQTNETDLSWLADNRVGKADVFAAQGYRVARLKDFSHGESFDNGIYRVQCAGDFELRHFDTDFAEYANLSYECATESTVSLLMYRNSIMKFAVNGEIVKKKDMPELNTFDADSGTVDVEFTQHSPPLDTFKLLKNTYLAVISLALLLIFTSAWKRKFS